MGVTDTNGFYANHSHYNRHIIDYSKQFLAKDLLQAIIGINVYRLDSYGLYTEL